MVVYIDPPYMGATGYEARFDRRSVLRYALDLEALGAAVAVSEAEPLDLPGWHAVELTAWGTGKPEWLTMSTTPARLPAVQQTLFGERAIPTP